MSLQDNVWINWHTARFLAWCANIPIAIFTPLKYSVAYLVFLSVAALVESSGTDVLGYVKDQREKQRTRVVKADPDVVDEAVAEVESDG